MFNFRAIIFVFFLTLSAGGSVICQSSADEKLLVRMTTVLELDSQQIVAIDSVFTSYASQLDSLNTTIKTIQTSDLAEEEISQKTSILFKERKDLRSWKKDQTMAQLTPEQAKTYESEILAKAKAVFHFGHDKAECKVCETPQDGAIFKK